MTFVWDRPPEVLQRNIEHYAETVQSSIGRVVLAEGQNSEGWMTVNAPWQNISGNARRGLRVYTEEGGSTLRKTWTMYFVHSVEYGIYLELKNGGRYAVLVPAMARAIGRLERNLEGLV